MTPSDGQKLKSVIVAALDASPNQPDRDIAISITSTEPILIAEHSPEWILEKLTALIRLQRNRRRAADPAQASFPFHDLSTPIPLKAGPVELRLSTIGILKQSVKFLSAKKKAAIDTPRRSSILGKLEREIEIMQPYVYGNRRITVEEVHELIARGTAPPPRDSKMSEAMRRYWDGKSQGERSDIAHRRERKKRNRQ